VNPAQNLKNSKVKLDSNLKTNRNNTGQLRTFSSVKATENKLEIDNNTQNITYTGETKLDELQFNKQDTGDSATKISFENLSINKLASKGLLEKTMENLFKDAGVDINDKSTYDNWWFKYGFDDINPIPKAERLDLVGKDLTITEIDNKHNIVIKTEKLKVDSIKNGAGGLYIDFKEGVIGEKGKEAIGFSEVDYVLSHSSSFPSNLRAHSNITIYTEKGHIDGDINTKGSGSRGIEVWVTGEGVISGDAYVMSSEMIPAFDWEGDLLESSSGSLHISLANGAKMLGDVLVENEYGYGVLVLQAGLIKSQMQGDINLKQGSMMLAMGDNTEISGEINIEKDGIMTIKDIAGFHKGKGVISNKITNEGFLNFDINSQLSSNDIIIENGIDNDGGIVNITSYNNDESYLGFLKKDGYHFKNINGGK
ncbi:hypothetical protein, partial [Helicobacter winghamensis]